MNDVLYQLYDGSLSRESLVFEKGTAYAEAADRLVAEEDRLRDTLNEAQKELLQAFSRAQSDVSFLAQREEFAAGVRLGARLMLAILDDTPAMLHPEAKE